MVALAAMLKSILNVFFWTKRAIELTQIGSIRVTCRSTVAKIILIGNPRWPPSWKSILNFFSWTKRPVDSNLSPASVAQLDTPPTGDQEVAGSTPAGSQHSFVEIIMKYFLWSFSPFRWFKKGSCQFLAKEFAHYILTTLRTKPAQ